MKTTPKIKDYRKELFAPVAWEQASVLNESDWIAYIGIRHEQIADRKIPLGTRFRAYYAPVEPFLRCYRLILFEIRAVTDPVRKISYRGFVVLAQADYNETIWGRHGLLPAP